ncbi:MAG: putative flagellar basal-body rod protein FlgF [Planctomycetota bacterium]|jgi:flagellar basal body rod protein FlgG
MSYGLQISASGVAAAMYRQDVLSNNLVNAGTVGFKPDLPSIRFRTDVRSEDGVMNLPSNKLLERLGGGVQVQRNSINFSNGPVELRADPLSIAVQSEGFLKVRNGPATDSTTLTRDGRLAINPKGELVLAANGMPVLDDSDQVIMMEEGLSVEIDGRGVIKQAGKPVGTIGLFRVADMSSITKAGDGLMTAPSRGVSSMAVDDRRIKQNAVEQSGVNELRTLMDMTSASREIDAHVAMMQHHDKMMEKAINSLSRVS